MKRLFKKLILSALTLVCLCSVAGAIDLYVDTELLKTDVPPTAVNGRTLVPVRAIFEAVGATVSWDQASQTAIGVKGDTTVSIQINSSIAYVNGNPVTLDVPAQAINQRTLVPARFISESLGCVVTWHQATQTAAVADELRDQSIFVTDMVYHFDGTCNSKAQASTLAEAMGSRLSPCKICVTGEEQPQTFPYDASFYTSDVSMGTTQSCHYLQENGKLYTISLYLPTTAYIELDGKEELFINTYSAGELLAILLANRSYTEAAPGNVTSGEVLAHWNDQKTVSGTIYRIYGAYTCEITHVQEDFNSSPVSIMVHKYNGKTLQLESTLSNDPANKDNYCTSLNGCRVVHIGSSTWISVDDLMQYFGISQTVRVVDVGDKRFHALRFD